MQSITKHTRHLLLCKLAEIDLNKASGKYENYLKPHQKLDSLTDDALKITVWDNQYDYYDSLSDEILVLLLINSHNGGSLE